MARSATAVASAATTLRDKDKRGGTAASSSARGGATVADVVARVGDIYRRGGVTMPSVRATMRRLQMRPR